MSPRSSRPIWLGEDRRRFDHIRVHISVVKDRKVGPAHFAVYSALVAHAETDTGEARPSLETIAGYFRGEDVGPVKLSERSVRRCLRDLERWSLVAVEERPGHASLYRVLEPPTPDDMSGVAQPTPDTPSAHPGHGDRATPDTTSAELEPLNKNQEPKAREARARVPNDEGFDDFWAAYPARNGRKIGKQKTLDVWCKLKPNHRAVAMQAVRTYARAVSSGETLAKDPFRWLRDGELVREWAQSPSPARSRYGSAQPAELARCPHRYPVIEDDAGYSSACSECSDTDLERAAAAFRRERLAVAE